MSDPPWDVRSRYYRWANFGMLVRDQPQLGASGAHAMSITTGDIMVGHGTRSMNVPSSETTQSPDSPLESMT